jgi:hypothetical protein
MDRAVLRAYPRLPSAGQTTAAKLPGAGSPNTSVIGWSDLPVPPYCITTAADKQALQTFEDAILDRLFILNAHRAEKQAALGLGNATGTKAKKAKQGSGDRGNRTREAPSNQTFLTLEAKRRH